MFKLRMPLRAFIVMLSLLLALSGTAVLQAAENAPEYSPTADQERGTRVIGNPNFVVFLYDDGSLEYYEVINSQGFYIGFTRPGWRNDRLGLRALIDSVSNGSVSANLFYLGNSIYGVELYRGGALLSSGSFSAAGIPGGQGAFAGGAAGASGSGATAQGSTVVNTQTTIVTSGNNSVSTTTTVNVGPSATAGSDIGVRSRANGHFNASTRIYTVARGDTLAGIARRFNVSISALAGANGIGNVNVIFAGQALRIP